MRDFSFREEGAKAALRVIIEEHHIKLYSIADFLGVSIPFVSMMYHQKRKIPTRFYSKILFLYKGLKKGDIEYVRV